MALNTYTQHQETPAPVTPRTARQEPAQAPVAWDATPSTPAPFKAGQTVRHAMHPMDTYTVVTCVPFYGSWEVETRHPYGSRNRYPAHLLTLVTVADE